MQNAFVLNTWHISSARIVDMKEEEEIVFTFWTLLAQCWNRKIQEIDAVKERSVVVTVLLFPLEEFSLDIR